MEIEIPLTRPQRAFCFSDQPHPAMIGGLGSGKSQAGMIRLLLLMMRNYSQSNTPCLSLMTFPTYDLCRLRGLTGTEEILEKLEIGYTTNKSEFAIHIQPFGTMLFRSYDRPERIVSFQAAYSVCDELDTLPKDKASHVWRKVVERTRQKVKSGNSVALVTTPDQGMSGFTYQRWGCKAPPPGYVLIPAPTASNPYLPEGYIDQIRANYDPILAEMYLNGEFVSLSQNKVYHFFSRQRHHTDRTIKPEERLYVGLDFNIGGTCASVWVIESNKPIAVDEFVSHDTQDFCSRLSKYKGHPLTVYPDASGKASRTNASQSDIAMIRQAGFAVDAPEANPAIRDRVNAMNALLAHDRMMVNTDKCPELTNAMETQGYTDKGEPEKFNQHPEPSDWADGAGYFIHRKFPVRKPVPIITNIPTAF